MTLANIYCFSTAKYSRWFGAWTVIALLFAYSEVTDAYDEGFNGAAWEPWVWLFTAFYSIAMLSPLIIHWCYRWPMEGDLRLKSTVKLTLTYLIWAPAHTLLMFAMRHLVYFIAGQYYAADANFAYELFKPLTAYFLVAFMGYAYIALARVQQEQAESNRLQLELAQARLENLQNQLQPHFLFNTLNLISSTMYQSVEKADDIIAELADLLRYALATGQKPFITLQQELGIAESYLNIVRLRFGERVSISIKVDKNDHELMVPAMLLQPLLENAVKHGIEPTTAPGSIDITVTHADNQLTLVIGNSCTDSKATTTSFGIGLNNIHQRLAHLYPEQFTFNLDVSHNGWAQVSIVIPADKMIGENKIE